MNTQTQESDQGEGVSCEEYTILIVALPREEIPAEVLERMTKHNEACSYHRSSGFIKSAIETPVTDEIVEAAREIVRKYGG